MVIMNTSADTFAAFVAELSDAIDEHDTTAVDLADRLHLSRSHLDHLVSAIAGESPARLRRRVLLERAAWRLVTTDRTILDVAVEAGYGSHEAFGRAFAQAYGQSPAAWRLEPTAIRLPAGNGVHFHPPAGLRLSGHPTSGGTDMSLITSMVEHHQWVVGELIHHSRTLTDAQLDAPITLSVAGIDCNPTLRSLLSRLVGQMDMWNTVLAMGDYDFAIEQHETLDELEARLARVGPIFLEAVRVADREGTMADTFVDVRDETSQVFSYAAMIAHVITYAAHRRTLVAGALETAGVTGVEDDPLSWLNDRWVADRHA